MLCPNLHQFWHRIKLSQKGDLKIENVLFYLLELGVSRMNINMTKMNNTILHLAKHNHKEFKNDHTVSRKEPEVDDFMKFS